MSGREIEFKFGVDDDGALDAFARALGLDRRTSPTRRQENHFFDSAEEHLRACGLSLRLRIENGHGLVTIKGKEVQRAEGGALTERFEAECTVTRADAQAILAGSLSPLEYLRGHPDPLVQEGCRLIRAALDGVELVYLGGFENERTTLPEVELEIGGRPQPLVFELDRTTFPQGRVDCEIEAEIGPEVDAHLTSAHLTELLARANIPWNPAPSKLARFLAILASSR